MTDRRIRAKAKHQDLLLDESSMEATITFGGEEVGTVPFKFEVCPTCRGSGTHVDPSIDSGGLTAEEMERRGPDFRARYERGDYDQPCNECDGRRVVPRLQPETEEHRRLVERRKERKRSAERSRQIQRQEKRMARGRGMR
jgi:hypothetical protein